MTGSIPSTAPVPLGQATNPAGPAGPGETAAIRLPRLPEWPGEVGPSHAGEVTLVVLVLILAVGLARVVGRRLDPRARAEARVFDRAGLDAIERRVLRRAAGRLEPSVPAVSLLLSEPLLAEASRPEVCPRADLAVLESIRRRRFGRGLMAVDARPTVDRPRPTGAVAGLIADGQGLPASDAAPAADPMADRRRRAASLLAAAIAVRDQRGESPRGPAAAGAAGGAARGAEPVMAGAGAATGVEPQG